MVEFLIKLLLVARSKLKSRARLEAENMVLRQQVIVLSRKARSRVRLRNIDRLIFVWLSRMFPSILDAITVIKPETVIRWHRRGFRAYWRWKSRQRGGRPRINREIRDLIRRMSKENTLWGASRIHAPQVESVCVICAPQACDGCEALSVPFFSALSFMITKNTGTKM